MGGGGGRIIFSFKVLMQIISLKPMSAALDKEPCFKSEREKFVRSKDGTISVMLMEERQY